MVEERKTPEQRATMTDLERLRHSASHVLATAILKIWPEAQFAAGPPVENGFYYDVDRAPRISPDDFEKCWAEMKKEIKANHPFEKMEVSRDEALELGKKGRLAALGDRDQPSKFKIDIIENIPAGEKISLYRNGDFIDLCAGPHVMRTGNIGAFKLTSVASAYYKGDEKNPQLQRVYGTAFKTKKELDDYFAMLEEAKKRDHRKLGKELEIYIIDDDVGPGLPMWLPRGAAIIDELEKLARETEFAAGYQRVRTPHIARESLYEKSGHLPYYADSMFPRMEVKRDVESMQALAKADGDLQKTEGQIAMLKRLADVFQSASGGARFKGGSYSGTDLTEILRALLTDTLKGLLGDLGIHLSESAAEASTGLQTAISKIEELRERAKAELDKLLKSHRYYLKAMNCPHHHKLFAAVP